MFEFRVQKAVLHPWKEKCKKDPHFDPIFHFDHTRLMPKVATYRNKLGQLGPSPEVTMYSTAELHRLWSNAQPTDKKAETACIREKDLEREQEKWAREAEEEWKAQHTHTGRPDKRNETELEIEKRKERENILRRADEMMMEREQEIMRLNTLLLAAQCHAVQEDQKVLKKQMQKVTEAEEMRIHNLMEDERRRAIKKEEQKMALRRQQMVELGKFQRQQMQEKREQIERDKMFERDFHKTDIGRQNTLISHSGFTKELEWLCDEQKKMQEIEDYRRAQTESPCVYFSREKRSMNDALTYEREKEERHRNEDHKYMQDKLRQPKKKSEEANIWEQRLRETMTKKLKYMKDVGLEDRHLAAVKRKLHFLPPL